MVRSRVRTCSVILQVALLLAAAFIAAAFPLAREAESAREAHRRVDSVLFPRFVAVWNEYALGHGAIPDKGHFDTLNAGDVKRWQTVREYFKELDQAMKQAGY